MGGAPKWWKWGGALFSGGSQKPNHLEGLALVTWEPSDVIHMKSIIAEFHGVCMWQYARSAKGLEIRPVILALLAPHCIKGHLLTWKKQGGRIREMHNPNTIGVNILVKNQILSLKWLKVV